MDKRTLANELWPFMRAKFDPGSGGSSAPIALVTPGSSTASKEFAYSGLGLSNTDDGTTYTLILTSTSNAVAASILASNAAGGLQLARLGVGVADAAGAPLHVLAASGEQLRLSNILGTAYAAHTVSGAGALTIANTGAVAANAHLYLLPGGNVGIGMNTAPSAKLEIVSITEQLRVGSSALAYATFMVSSTGNLTFSTSGPNVYTTSHLAHPSYVSQLLNWRISSYGEADFRYIYTDELHAKAFIADLEQALAGGQIVSKSVAKVAVDFNLPTAGGTDTLYVEEFAGFAGFHVFVDGDLIRLRQFDRSGGGLKISDAWGTVVYAGQSISANPPTQYYTFTRHATYPGAGAGTIKTGVLAIDYGTTGNGYTEQNAIDGLNGVNSPYYQIVTWNTHPKSVVAGQGLQLRVRLGQLRGLTGANQWGLYAGTGWTANPNEGNVASYSVTTPTVNDQHRYIIAGDNGVQIYNADLTIYSSTTPVISLSRTAPSIAVGAGSDTMTFSAGPSGFWVGNSGGTYKMRLGAVSGGSLTQGMSWDGSALRILGSAIIGNGAGYSTTALLYCRFDCTASGGVINTNGHLGQAAVVMGTIATQSGIFANNAIRIQGSGYVTYPSASNLATSIGSISFWMNPAWDGNDATNRDIFFCGTGYFAANCIRIGRTPAQDGGNIIRFLVADSGGGGRFADYATPTSGFKVWAYYTFTWNSGTGSIKIYRNAVLVAAYAGTTWTAGGAASLIEFSKNYPGDQGIQDFAIIGRELNADEILSVYRSNAPLNVLQSNYDLVLADASSAGFVRGNATGLFGYSAITGAAGTGAFALVTTNGTAFDGQTMDAGDFMLGGVNSGLANLFFDRSLGRLVIRMGSVERIAMNETGAFGIKDSSGANNVLLFSSTAGNQILQRVDLYGTGSITAGTAFDDVIFDATGVTLKALTSYADLNAVKWKYSGAFVGSVYGKVTTGALSSTMVMQSIPYSGGTNANIDLTAYSSSGAAARLFMNGVPNSATGGSYSRWEFYNTGGTHIGGSVIFCSTTGTSATITGSSFIRYRMHYRLVVRASGGNVATLTGDIGVSGSVVATVGATASDFRVGVAAGGYAYWDRLAGAETYEVTFWAIYV